MGAGNRFGPAPRVVVPPRQDYPNRGFGPPRADLEQFEYQSQNSTLGLPADCPLVQWQLPADFEMWDGKTREDYVELYAKGTRPNGAPRVRSDALTG
jgi:hypothetical protein